MKSIIPLILATIVIVLAQGCAIPIDVEPTDLPPNFSTDPEFKTYIEEFERYHKASTAHVPIGFADLDANRAGVCYKTSYGGELLWAYIKIDKDYWPKLSEYQKVNLIFHELGHCVLNRPHVQSNSVMLCPSSFMYDTVMSTACLKDNYEVYVGEMFP